MPTISDPVHMAQPGKTAVIFGATGLVGRHCLDALLRDDRYQRIVSIGRRATGTTNTKLLEVVMPLDQLAHIDRDQLGHIDDAFCCLGTTQNAAGSAAEFRRIECLFTQAAARLAKAQGASAFLMISALGANASSAVFYNKVKGEAETAVIAVGIESTSLFRPSLLLGERAEFRWKEKLSAPFMQVISAIMVGPARKFRPIRADVVARAMVKVAAKPKLGVAAYESDAISDITAA